MGRAPGLEAPPPFLARPAPLLGPLAEQPAHLVRHQERRLGRPADRLLGRRRFLRAERLAVGPGAVVLPGAAGRDVGARDDQAGPRDLSPGRIERLPGL